VARQALDHLAAHTPPRPKSDPLGSVGSGWNGEDSNYKGRFLAVSLGGSLGLGRGPSSPPSRKKVAVSYTKCSPVPRGVLLYTHTPPRQREHSLYVVTAAQCPNASVPAPSRKTCQPDTGHQHGQRVSHAIRSDEQHRERHIVIPCIRARTHGGTYICND